MTIEEKELLVQEIKDLVVQQIKEEYFLVNKKFTVASQDKEDIIDKVMFFVCEKLFLQPHEVKTKTRLHEVVTARHIIFYILRKVSHAILSFSDIGKQFGNDHATVLYATRKIEDRMEVDRAFRHKVMTIAAEFEEMYSEEIKKFKI